MNKVILMGRLVKNPEVKYTKSDNPMAICNYTLAVRKNYIREGEPEANFIRCVAIGKQAEFTAQYLRQGMQILVTGELQIRSWEDEEKGRQWSTEVFIEKQEFTESKASFDARSQSNGNELNGIIEEDIKDEDMPF